VSTRRALLIEYLRRFGRTPNPFESLEDLFTSPKGFGVTTATDLQRAICRLIEGRPLGELAAHPHVLEAVGGKHWERDPPDLSAVDGIQPRKVVWLAGIRTAKSLMAAALIVWAALTVDASGTGAHEVPRHSTLSTEKDLAAVILNHLVGAIMASDTLKSMLVGEPTATGCMLRMSCGRAMEAKVVAGAKSGRSVVARWSTGFVADEAPRMAGAGDAVVNLDDTETAVEGRILPGGQILWIGSPWAPMGPVYEAVRKGEGYPTPDLLVIRARGDRLNPYWWTPKRAERLRKRNPVAYQTDFLAQFADQEETLFTQAVMNPCIRDGGTIPPEPGHDYAAAMDPATRGNAWTFVIGDRVGRTKRIVFCRQWVGSPLDPVKARKVFAEIGPILYSYNLDWIYTDQWSADTLSEIAEEAVLDEATDTTGITLDIEHWTEQTKTLAYTGFRDAMVDGTIELINDPVLLGDLRLVRKKITQRGVTIELPKTADGRHCDYAPSTVRCLTRWIEEDEEQPPPEGTKERAQWDAEERHEKAAAALEAEAEGEWWEQ
jgi:hypothetical protein